MKVRGQAGSYRKGRNRPARLCSHEQASVVKVIASNVEQSVRSWPPRPLPQPKQTNTREQRSNWKNPDHNRLCLISKSLLIIAERSTWRRQRRKVFNGLYKTSRNVPQSALKYTSSIIIFRLGPQRAALPLNCFAVNFIKSQRLSHQGQIKQEWTVILEELWRYSMYGNTNRNQMR